MPVNPESGAAAKSYWEHAFQSRISLYDSLVEQHRGTAVSHDAMAVVDSELQALQIQLALFYRRVNALRPVSRLSPEILSLIFHYLSALEPTVPADPEVLESREARRNLVPTKTWIKVTYVCSTFRQCALGDRSLWTATTSAFGSEWMTLLAERAQVPPKSVHVGVEPPVLSELKLLLSRAHNVQITKLRPTDSLEKSMVALPEVRSLRIHVADTGRTATPSESNWITFKPMEHMPHLTSIHIYGVHDFNLKNPCLTSTLTSLYIGCQRDNLIRRRISDVLAVLTLLPLLESLTLIHCGVMGEVPEERLSVPALRYLKLEAETFPDIAGIFGALDLSQGARVHLAAEDPGSMGREREVWGVLRRALSQQTWADLHTLELLYLPEAEPELLRRMNPQDEDSVTISAWREDEPDYVCVTGSPSGDRRTQLQLGTTQELRPEPDLSIRLLGYFGGLGKDSTIIKVAALFSKASELRTLSLRLDRIVDSKLPWLDILVQHPRLTAIRADQGQDIDRLFATLHFMDEPLLARELRTVSFPYLRNPWAFWGSSVDWKHPSIKNKKKRGERGALIASVLQQRAAAGAPLTNVYLDQSELEKKELWDSLKKGSKGHPDFVQQARQIFKPVSMWNWEDWGRGLGK